jgi:hypothetical protein
MFNSLIRYIGHRVIISYEPVEFYDLSTEFSYLPSLEINYYDLSVEFSYLPSLEINLYDLSVEFAYSAVDPPP